MTSPPQPPPDPAAAPGRRGQEGLWAWLRGLGIARSDENRWLTGVAGGLAVRFGVDPVLVRAGFVLLAIFGGLGVPLYALAWALLPDAQGSILAERAVRQRDKRSVGLLVLVAALVLGNLDGGRAWWSVLPVAALLYWFYRSRRRTATRTTGSIPVWTPPTTTTPYAAPPPAPTLAAPVPAYGDPAAAAAHGTPYGMGPGRTGAVSPPTGALAPPRAQRRRAGVLGLLLTVGLGIAGAAVATEVHGDLRSSGSVPAGLGQVPFTLGCALAGVGLALLLIGLLGRRAGVTGLLAVALTAATVASASVPPFVFSTGADDRSWRASEPEPAGGYVVGLGDGRLDLRGATAGQQFEVKVWLGDLTVLVPAGVRATIKPSLGMGDLAVNGVREKVGQQSSIEVGKGPTSVTIVADLMAGDLEITVVPAPGPTPTGGAT
ncbi:PspC domain-containing protein [Dermatophilaceae bacterium Soc4.6]